MWNVTFYDDDTGYAYRVRVKRLTVGDAVEMDMLSDDITRRDDLQGRDLLMRSQQYPFARYCTVACERVVIEDAPDTSDPVPRDDAAWQAFDLTEETFMALPEFFMLQWLNAAVSKNPHRDPAYEMLKKKLLREKLRQTNTPPSDAASNSATDSANGSSSD